MCVDIVGIYKITLHVDIVRIYKITLHVDIVRIYKITLHVVHGLQEYTKYVRT